jgi:hypothetical protein
MAARKPAKPKPDPLVREEDGRLYAVVDLLVARPNLGPSKHTPIRAGHLIPAEFADLPRRRKP